MTIETINDLTALPSRSGLGYFCYLLDQSGITESNKITNVANHTMALLKSQGKKGLKAHRDLIELEERWYQSLRIKKSLEVKELGIFNDLEKSIKIIEWPEICLPIINENHIKIRISQFANSERQVEIEFDDINHSYLTNTL